MILFLVLLLAACGQAQPIAEPVVVKVPVAVPCNAASVAEPDWNLDQLAEGSAPVEKLKAVLADLELSRGYIEELKAELEGCS